ncbi:hypothetical protein M9H77_30073 [Catharanthus roseus]|uniref:Uncharacterized protein n=1 Tax=Catharanthus roseus TaxID=4058 RepID=A0ACB9ZWK7_CATRO|nr:hypothetical protein M9H77_30073 [Catharanthus roseus]
MLQDMSIPILKGVMEITIIVAHLKHSFKALTNSMMARRSRGRGNHRLIEEIPRHEAYHEDNLFDDYVENPNVGQEYFGGYFRGQQADKALDQIEWKVPSFKGESDLNVFLDWECPVENLFMKHERPKMVVKDNPKPKVEQKAINYPTKRTLILREDLNGWIKKDDEESLENIIDDENNDKDGTIGDASLDVLGRGLGVIMSIEAQLPTHYNEGTSGSSSSNLDPMKQHLRTCHVTSPTQWGYGNFSPLARSYEHNSYDCYEGNRLGTRNGRNDRTYNKVSRNEVRNEGNYEAYYETNSYGGYSCGRNSQTLGTTSRHLSYNNLKLPLLWNTFCPYEYEAWEQNVELLFYSYGVREEEKFLLALKSLSYEVNV